MNLIEEKNAIISKWIFKVKTKNNNKLNKLKAQLIVWKFKQTYRVDHFNTYALVVTLLR